MTQTESAPPRPWVCDADWALYEEYEAIFGADPNCPPAARSNERADWLQAQPRTALCLSGGGIRSASFCMGALRSLAGNGLLHQVHYLSTVSGGGYIGGWLLRIAADRGVAGAETVLSGTQGVEQVKDLREFTNFLAPTPGLFSGDSMAGAVLYLRNLLVGWFIFVPALVAVTLGCFALNDIATLISGGHADDGRPNASCWGDGLPAMAYLLLGCGLIALLYAGFQSCRLIPSHAGTPVPPAREFGATDASILRRVVLPTLLWALLATLAYVALGRLPKHPSPLAENFVLLPICASATLMLAYLLAWESLRRRGRPEDSAVFAANVWFWALGCLVSAVVLWGAGYFGRNLGGAALEARGLVSLGPLAVVVAHLMQSFLYIALRRGAPLAPIDREWLARVNSTKLTYALVFTAVMVAAVMLPPSVPNGHVWLQVLLTGGVAAGPVGAYLGRVVSDFVTAAAAGTTKRRQLTDIVLPLAALAFLLALFTGSGLLIDWVLTRIVPTSAGSELVMTLLAAVVLMWAATTLGRSIDANRFSLHAVYRNRLVRAFLGSARASAARRPEAYTRFDPADDAPLDTMLGHRDGVPRALFPVIGVTLNLVGGKRTAWAERKAAPFTLTPLRCGAAELHQPQVASMLRGLGADRVDLGARVIGGGWTGAASRPDGAYALTSAYGDSFGNDFDPEAGHGLSLGTAMTLSGAAVSPSMGYHSSPAAAFLMTVFNVRLGLWLPNPALLPATPADPREGQRPNALWTLLQEMRGQTDDTGPSVYLTDGGHFDNLGLYEMLRRRCSRIIVIDVGEDPNYLYGDLGRTLQQAAIDLDVGVTFDPPLDPRNPVLPATGLFGKIDYFERASDAVDRDEGELLIIKAWVPKDAPPSVLAYKATHDAFPHDSTANQFFTESQFEAYRRLGEHVAHGVVGRHDSIESLFAAARPRPAAPQE